MKGILRLWMTRVLFEWRKVPLAYKLRFVIWKDHQGW